MPSKRLALCLTLLFLAFCSPTFASDDLRKSIPMDKLEPKKGNPLEGTVMLFDKEQVVIRVRGRDRHFSQEEVRSIKAKVIDIPAALHMHANLREDDITSRLQLAKDFELLGLPLESRLLLWEVLVLDEVNDEAHTALGHRKSGKRWLVPVGKRWHPLSKAKTLHSQFKDAWQLPTSHFNLRTDLPLAKALEMAWLLEGSYYSFHELIGSEMGLYHVIDPMDICIYTRLSDFPDQQRGPGFFSPAQRAAYTLYDPATNTVQVHEMVHSIMFFAKEIMGSKPVIPGWIDEGFAEYLPRAIDKTGLPLKDRGELLGHAKHHFEVQSESKKPYGLKRSLTLSAGDFHADNLQAEKYAASYALTHYLLHGESGALREPFMEFLRGAVDGKATSQSFKKAMEIKKVRDFDEAWAQYSKAMAEI